MPQYNLVRFTRKYEQRFIVDLKIYFICCLSFIFLKEISQTLWIQNVVNFNDALVLPRVSLGDKKIK
jgi:hypothetical protein